METYYVRAKTGRRHGFSWAMVEAAGPEGAKNKFIREHNAELKKTYAGFDLSPEYWERKLLTPSKVTVRKTPPTRGDIYSSTKGVVHDEYVARPRSPRAAASGGRKTMADKQFDLLVAESQRVRMPLHYSNDLYKHDRSILRKWKPRAFVWVVRDNGTHLYPLDKGGKPLDARGVTTLVTSVEYHVKSPGHKIYLVKGASLKELAPSAALNLVRDVARGAKGW